MFGGASVAHVFDRFLPSTFSDYQVVDLDEEMNPQEKRDGGWKKKSYRISFSDWLIAWDRLSAFLFPISCGRQRFLAPAMRLLLHVWGR